MSLVLGCQMQTASCVWAVLEVIYAAYESAGHQRHRHGSARSSPTGRTGQETTGAETAADLVSIELLHQHRPPLIADVGHE